MIKNKPVRHNIASHTKVGFSRAKEGDLVQISVEDHEKRRNIWTIFKGINNGIDTFITEEKVEPRVAGDYRLVAIYTSPRESHDYDRNLGIILKENSYQLRFIGPRNTEYGSFVRELKEKDLWREN